MVYMRLGERYIKVKVLKSDATCHLDYNFNYIELVWSEKTFLIKICLKTKLKLKYNN